MTEHIVHQELPNRSLSLDDFRIGQLFWEVRDGVAVLDVASGRIVHWNPAAEELFGVSAREAVGQSLEAVLPEFRRAQQHPNAIGCQSSMLEGFMQEVQPIEAEVLRRPGAAMMVEFTLSPIAARHAPGHFALAIIRDVTARKEALANQLRLAHEHAARTTAAAEAEAAALLNTVPTHRRKDSPSLITSYASRE